MDELNKKIRILLVEDDVYLSRACQDSFISEGFNVEIAHNGIEAIEKIYLLRPDIVLLDLVMPVKNGFEVLEEIKIDKQTKDIPVIVFTNLGQESDVKKAKRLGAVDYLVKSNLSMKELIGKVREHVAEDFIKRKTEKFDSIM